MKLRLLALLAALAIGSIASAQSLNDYLKLRRQLKISTPTSGNTLLSLVGTKSFEVRAKVKGVITVEGLSYIMADVDGEMVKISTRSAPDWLSGSEIDVRMLIKASREHETADLTSFLLSAAPDEQVSPYDATAKTQSSSPPPTTNTQVDRSGLRGSITGKGSFSGKTTSRGGASARNWTVQASDATPIYASFIKARNKNLTDEQAYRIAQGVIGFSLQYGVDARLIMSIIIVESGFDPNSRSHSGAMGLGQLMPATAAGLGVSRPYDINENLYGTVRTIRGHLERYKKQTGDDFESLILSVAAYNAGSGAVKRAKGIPPFRETQNYVKKVISTYQQLTGTN